MEDELDEIVMDFEDEGDKDIYSDYFSEEDYIFANYINGRFFIGGKGPVKSYLLFRNFKHLNYLN